MVEVKQDISIIKQDVSELKEGQKRMKREIRLNTAAVNEIAGEQLRIKSRVNDLEQASV